MFTVVVRTTIEKDRTKTISLFSAARMLGIVMGKLLRKILSCISTSHRNRLRFIKVQQYDLQIA